MKPYNLVLDDSDPVARSIQRLSYPLTSLILCTAAHHHEVSIVFTNLIRPLITVRAQDEDLIRRSLVVHGRTGGVGDLVYCILDDEFQGFGAWVRKISMVSWVSGVLVRNCGYGDGEIVYCEKNLNTYSVVQCDCDLGDSYLLESLCRIGFLLIQPCLYV